MAPSALLPRLLCLDRSLSRRCLVQASKAPVAYTIMAVLAHAGDASLLAVLGVALWLRLPYQRSHLVLAALAVLMCAAAVGAIKTVAKRERPLGESSARWSATPKHDVYSFPSGHAARVACLAAWSAAAWPMVLPWLVLWALLVGVARVAVGAHYWLDVLTGWFVGAAMAWLLLELSGICS